MSKFLIFKTKFMKYVVFPFASIVSGSYAAAFLYDTGLDTRSAGWLFAFGITLMIPAYTRDVENEFKKQDRV